MPDTSISDPILPVGHPPPHRLSSSFLLYSSLSHTNRILLLSSIIPVYNVARGGLGCDEQPRGEDTDGPEEQSLQVVRSPCCNTPFCSLETILMRTCVYVYVCRLGEVDEGMKNAQLLLVKQNTQVTSSPYPSPSSAEHSSSLLILVRNIPLHHSIELNYVCIFRSSP